jgi:thioredoxin 1
MLSPVIEELSNEMEGIVFAKVNVDENPLIAQENKVASIPTLVIYKNGKPIETMVGFKPKQELKTVLQKYI